MDPGARLLGVRDARLDGRRIRGVAGKEEEYRAEHERHCKNAAAWGLEIDPPVSGP